MNYVIKDEQKYARICLDNFSEQLTPVNDLFRIIILVDRKFINSVEMAFLNRLEKMKITFDQLLDNDQSILTRKIINEIDLRDHIEDYQKQVMYNLRDLLINCGREEIEGLIYNNYIEMKKNNNNSKINEELIKEIVYNKISNILPQDIISILPEKNIIRTQYYNKQYINDENYKNYRISIIYTFSNLANTIDGSNNEMSFMVSEIKNEKQLEITINELKNKNENNKIEKDYNILIHFEQLNSNKIQFISNFINKNYKQDKYYYIFIIHIKRNFDSKNDERIYSIPDINHDIKQLFIDNLNGKNIRLKDLLEKDIKNIMDDNDELMNLDREFKRALTSFVYKELNEKNKSKILGNFNNEKGLLNEDNYCEEIIKYMDEDTDFKQKIILKAKQLIENDKEAEGDCKSLVDKIIKNMGKNSIDIISCLLDYIKEQIFSKYLMHIFKVLEDSNFLTTLVEIKINNNNKLDENIIDELKDKFLDVINMDKNDYEPKFLFNYIIPGLYNFYKNLSNFIQKNINVEHFNNEKNLREYFSSNSEKEKKDFHDKEELLLSDIYNEINEDKFMYEIINSIAPDLILKDYITYYLNKYIITNTKNDINNELIHLLLNLRFNKEKNEIIKNNIGSPIKLVLIKIMWIESNINYISNILMIFEKAKEFFNDDGKILYNMIEEKINDENKSIRYITNENRNPEHTREVNECYYIFLAILCFIITSDKIKLTESLNLSSDKKDDNIATVEINHYCGILKEINNILQNISTDLLLYLNEMYIIDELIEIIELQKLKKIDIEKIQKIREYLRKSAEILQNNQPDKINELIGNLDDIYKELSISKDILIKEDKKYYDKYYDTLRFIFYKEINKIADINYRVKILEYLIKEKEIIKKSNDIFQILLKQYVKKNNFKKARKLILEGKDEIIKVIENNLLDSQQDNYFSLTETLLYFFEKNSFIYLKSVLYDEKEPLSLEKEPMDIFKECYEALQDLIEGKKKEKYDKNNKYITKLFCLGYIKTYCYTFIKVFDNDKAKYDPEKIIETINKKKLICKMIRLYIYKILYNQNQIDVFLNQKNKDKYKLGKYEGFKDFIKFSEEERIKYGFETLDNDNYEKVYKTIEKYKKDSFKNKIKKDEFENDDNKLHIDNFYIASSNLILLRLKINDFETSDIYENFYKNVCKPLFEKKKKFLSLIEFLFNPKKYGEIKKEYGIISKNIEAILYGYRYSLNELLSDEDDDDNEHDYIYSSLYNLGKCTYLSEKYYPGTDTREEPYYVLFSKIKNHFTEKPNEGCYVCLCEKGFYHSVPSGFPGSLQKDLKCQSCFKEIGSKEILNEKELKTVYEIVKRNKYYRIFKDDEEIDSLKKNKGKREKLNEINYMTLKQFEEIYMSPLYKKEKGLPTIEMNYFFKDNKIIRNLSQISYRLLNYILYSHLFFARLFTKSNKFDKYKPKDMNWGDTLNECFILLKNELFKKGIDSIEIFMNYAFKELFEKLHEKECIDNYEELIDFENNLESLIQEKIEKSVEEIKKYNEIINKNSSDKDSSISLLKEKYENNNYKKEEYPYYKYFYYSDYLDEDYIMNKILSHMDKNKYPLLNKYLNYKKIVIKIKIIIH